MREAKRIDEIREVRVADVIERDRLRSVSEAGVAALLSSIEDLGGITDPIHVRKVKHQGGELVLMAGSHRLEAARRLGWESIPAVAWDCSNEWARLKEIDDNAAGAELTALDTAVFLAERKRVYEKLHPEARHGGDRRSDQADKMSTWSFARATAEKFGISDRHVRRLVLAGETLDPFFVTQLRRAPKPVSLSDLNVISKISDYSERGAVVDALSEGRAKNAAAARQQWASRDRVVDVPDPVDVEFRKLSDTWGRASKAARRRFVAEASEELAELLAEASDE